MNGAAPPDPHATAPQAESPDGQSAPLPETAAPASGEHVTPDADATELAPVVVNPDAVKKRVAQAKPRATSAGALTTPTFEPSQELSVTPFSALTAEESSAISYTVSQAGVATKFDLPPREIPQTVVVTTQKLIKDFNLTDVKQILQFTPGIYVENERNVGSYQYFSRGYQLQVQFDGVPSAVRIGDRDAISLDSAMIDRVEVLQGAAGLLTGAGAPGGTINIVRKMPTKTQGGYVEATAGPWDGGRLVADVSTPIDASGKVRTRLVGVYNYNDSYIDYVSNEQGMFYGVVQADLTRTTLLTAGANVNGLDGSNGAAYGLPTAHDGSDLRLPRELNLGADWADEKRLSQNYFVKLDQDLGAKWKFQAQVTEYLANADFLESSTYYSVDPKTGEGAGVWGAKEAWDTDSTGVDLYTSGPFKLFGQEHQLMAGANGYQNSLWSAGYTETVDALEWINIYNHDPLNVPGPNTLPWVVYGPDSTTATLQYGTFAATRLNPLKPVHVLLGGRYSWYEAEIDGEQVLNEDAVFTPYGGIVLDVMKWASVYYSYTDIFQPNDPFLKDVSGNVLPPEVGVNQEVGLKTEFYDGKLNSWLAFFRIDHSNLAELDPNAPPFSCNGADCYRATGLVISEGIDVGIAGALSKDWNIFGGYTYLHQTYANGELKGERFRPQTPANLFKMAMSYSIPNTRWTFGGNVQYRGDIYAEGLNWFIPDTPWLIAQDGVWLFGLMTKFQATEQTYVLFTVDNLFDEEYYSGISVPYHGQVYGDPRKATLSLRKSF